MEEECEVVEEREENPGRLAVGNRAGGVIPHINLILPPKKEEEEEEGRRGLIKKYFFVLRLKSNICS